MPDMEFDADDQSGAETLDETNLTPDGEDLANFDEIQDVYDVTAREGDDDEDDLALDAADFDDVELTADDLEEDDDVEVEVLSLDSDQADFDGEEGLLSASPDEIDGLFDETGDADTVEGGEDDFTNFQSKSVSDADLRRMGYAMEDEHKITPQEEDRSFKSGHPDDVPDNRKRSKEKELDHGLKETFPASDPVSINPGAD